MSVNPANPAECPDEITFVGFVEGQLAGSALASFERHVDGCRDCRALVTELLRPRSILGKRAVPSDPLAGLAMGRYVILEALGCGGMSVVYLAYDPQLDRRVALKVLRANVADSVSAARQVRLVREAKAMARLSHPNVISVYDAGTIDDQVFVAMEYVEGQTLSQWLAQEPRFFREIIDVFTSAGRGLAAAHDAGLVHGDFKPENVLCGRDGRVRVTDFGLARPIEEAAAPEQRAKVGTPAYMAPEQHAGLPPDVHSDQFNFCVALYEGLYGERPTVGESVRIPDAPRGTRVPAALRKIVLRGLSASKPERYRSMTQLLGALEHALRPVWQRGLAVAAVVAVIAAGVVGFARGRNLTARACGGAESRLAGVWDAARKQQIHAQFLATGKPYAQDVWTRVERALDDYTSRWVATAVATCEATRVSRQQSEDLLQLRMQCLEQRLLDVRSLSEVLTTADDAVVQRSVDAAMTLQSLKDCAAAEVSKVLIHPPGDAETRKRVENVRAALSRAKALSRASRYAQALQIDRAAIAEARATRYLPVEAEALYRWGADQARSGDTKNAEATLLDAVSAAEASQHDAVAVQAWIDLMYFVGYGKANYEQALRWNRYAAAAIRRVGGGEQMESGRLRMLGIIQYFQYRHDEALANLQESLAVCEREAGPADYCVPPSVQMIALVAERKGNFEEATRLGRRAAEAAEKLLGPQNRLTSSALSCAAMPLLDLGRDEEALPLYRRALAITESVVGPETAENALSLRNMASVLTNLGRLEEALPYHERALAIYRQRVGNENPGTAGAIDRKGEWFRRAGRLDEAEKQFREALAIYEKVEGADHPDVAAECYQLGLIARARGKPQQARELFERGLAICQHAPGFEMWQYERLVLERADTLRELGDPAAAIAPLEQILALRSGKVEDPRFLSRLREALARAQREAEAARR